MRSLRVALVLLLLALGLTPGVGTAAGAEETSPRAQQWGLDRVRAPEAWSTSRGDGVVVAVVDTGVDPTHPDLAPRLLRDGDGRVVGRDEVDGDGDATDGDGHGTHVAGIVAAAAETGLRGRGIAGVAPRARIMPVRVLDDTGRGSFAALDRGIRWAVDHGADVVNLSLESAVPLPGELVASGPDDAVRYAWERGVPVVAAAGNSGTPFTDYHSSTPVVLVGASDRNDRRAAFSDAGRSDMVFAPGVDILSTSCDPCGDRSGHSYEAKSGTSFAAPHVAGALALLLAHGATAEQAVERLRATTVDLAGGGTGASTGHGLIDAAAAVRAVDEVSRREQGTAEPPSPDGPRTEGGGESAGESSPDPAVGEARPQDGPSPQEAGGPSDEQVTRPPPEEEAGDPTDAEDPDDADRPEPPEPDGTPDVSDAVAVPQPPGGLDARVGLLEGFAGALVLGSAVAVVGVRRRLGGF